MVKETKQDKGAQMLLKRGFTEINQIRKYRVFKNPEREDTLYFIGKRGAIRAGKNISSSYSIEKVK